MNNELEPLLETASRDALVKALRRAVGMIETDANSTDGLDRFLEDRKEELAQLLSAPSVGRVTDEQGGLPVTPNSSSPESTQGAADKGFLRLRCLICERGANDLPAPHYLQRINNKGTTGMWLCTEHLNPELSYPALPLPLSEEAKKDL